MTSTLNYRSYVKDDLQGILSIWENNSDFGALSEEVFESWFLRTPYEKAEIIVAENEEKQIIGQMIFMPTRMVVNGELKKAIRIAAPILDANYRFTNAESHPIFKMFLKGIEQAREQGFSIAYIFPARGWLRAIEMYSENLMKWQTATYKTFSVAIKSPANAELENTDFDFRIVKIFTEEYDQLWEKAIISFPITCGIVRRKEWLSYRLSDHCIIEARNRTDDVLKGYFVVKKKSGLLVDMLATSKHDMEKIFRGSLKMLALVYPGNSLIETGKVTGMYTDMMAFVLGNMQAEFPDYKFDFGCCVLDDSIDFEDIKATQWFMFPDV